MSGGRSPSTSLQCRESNAPRLGEKLNLSASHSVTYFAERWDRHLFAFLIDRQDACPTNAVSNLPHCSSRGWRHRIEPLSFSWAHSSLARSEPAFPSTVFEVRHCFGHSSHDSSPHAISTETQELRSSFCTLNYRGSCYQRLDLTGLSNTTDCNALSNK
jgi:hypothetical protein